MTSAKCEWGYISLRLTVADRISVDTCTDLLPERKPRYVMGIVSSTALPYAGITDLS